MMMVSILIIFDSWRSLRGYVGGVYGSTAGIRHGCWHFLFFVDWIVIMM